jgi:hypothetical protein
LLYIAALCELVTARDAEAKSKLGEMNVTPGQDCLQERRGI